MECIILCFSAVEPEKVLPGLKDVFNPQQRGELYQAMIDDALELTQEMGVKRFIACSPSANHPYFQALLKRLYIEVADHPGQDPATRTKNALQIGFQKNFRKIVLWDGLAPTFSSKMLKDALSRLEKADLVLGPSMDYGTFLIGAKGKTPDIFDKVKWDSPAEFSSLVQVAEGSKLETSVLGVFYRLYRKNDLPYFLMNLQQVQKSQLRIARHTIKVLEKFNLR